MSALKLDRKIFIYYRTFQILYLKTNIISIPPNFFKVYCLTIHQKVYRIYFNTLEKILNHSYDKRKDTFTKTRKEKVLCRKYIQLIVRK